MGSVEELMTMLAEIFAKLRCDDGPRHVTLQALPAIILKRFAQRLDPKELGHKKLSLVMADAKMTEKFEVKASCIYEVQPSCNTSVDKCLK